ncbi:hypothetical protein Tco_0404451 [Tanacetum coccineum]
MEAVAKIVSPMVGTGENVRNEKDAAYHKEKMLLCKQEKLGSVNATRADWKDDTEELCAHQETISIMSQAKEAQIKLYKTREDKELDKVIALENKVKVLNDIVYKTGQTVQTMNMLNRNCKTSFAKPEFLKKAQRANPRLYDIGCYNDNLALMLAPDSDETIRLEKERRSKLSDLIRPFDYDQLNNLYDLFVPQREKSPDISISKNAKMSQTSTRKGISKGVIPNTSVSRTNSFNSNHPGDIVMSINIPGRKPRSNDSLNLEKYLLNVNLSVLLCGKVGCAEDNHLVEIVLFIVDSGCSKHITGNLKLLTNFVVPELKGCLVIEFRGFIEYGTMPTSRENVLADLDLLEQHLTKDILSRTDCNTTLTKLRTTFENAFNSKFKERMQKYTRFDAQSFQDAMICKMDSIGKYMLEITVH